jgi:cell division protein FtsQ
MTLKIKGMIRTIFAILEQDPFLKAQITAVEFDENDEIMMYPRIGNHKIIVGNVNRLAEKLKNLKMFYQKGLNKVGWGSYSSINLKFDNQVVCTKR